MLGLEEGVMLDVMLSGNAREETVYRSKICGYVKESKTVSIYIPRKFGVDLDLSRHTGTFLIVAYTDRYLIKYKCKFLRYTEEGRVVFAEIKVLGEGEKVQRRQFYRLNKTMAIKFDVEATQPKKVQGEKSKTIIKPELVKNKLIKETETLEGFLEGFEALIAEHEMEHPLENREGTLIDISGGGLRFHSNEKLDKDNIINTHITLDNKSITMKCKLKVVDRVDSLDTQNRFEYRTQFVDIPLETQKHILDFVWKEQRMQQKIAKGLGKV